MLFCIYSEKLQSEYLICFQSRILEKEEEEGEESENYRNLKYQVFAVMTLSNIYVFIISDTVLHPLLQAMQNSSFVS